MGIPVSHPLADDLVQTPRLVPSFTSCRFLVHVGGNERRMTKTHANHAFVVRGSTEASDRILELVDEMDEAELIYQTHSYDDLNVVEGSPDE